MALPTQVQAALDAAEATLAAAQNPESNTMEAASVEAVAPTEQVQQADPQPQVAAPEPATQQPSQDSIWEQRYKILQGKYNAEVPDLHRKVHNLEGKLESAIQNLEKATREVPKEQPKAVDAKDVENFGSDLVDMVQRVATLVTGQLSQAFDAKINAFGKELDVVKQQLLGTTKTVAMTAEQTFFDRLTKLVPDWERLNADQSFLAWLAQVDPVYGVPRQAALQRAQDALNADHAAAVFNAFAPAKPAQAKGPDPLEKQVSPKSAGAEQPQPAQQQVITSAQITAFYDDVRKGLYRGKEAQAAQIEQIINTALAEGRVR